MTEKDKLLIKLIKSVKMDNPSPDFTDNVIALLEEEPLRNEEMDIIFVSSQKMDLLPSIPDNFSAKTMGILEEYLNQPSFEPLISKKTKTILTGGFVLFYIFLLFDEFFLNILHVSGKSIFKVEWFEEVSRIPEIFWISIFSLVILLLLDLAFKKTEILNTK